MKSALVKDSLLFHPAHGLCRISSITKAAGSAEVQYELIPISQPHAKIRYIIPQKVLSESGFHPLMSSRQAKSILEFFKTGKKKSTESDDAWTMAVTIHSESESRENIKDARMRQKLSQAAKALSAELAYTLNMSVKEICDTIRQNLRQKSSINQRVLVALNQAESD